MARLRVEIDLVAIRQNAARLVQLLGPSELWAVVKADGYGHGAGRSARAALAGGASRIGVATLGEGRALRLALGPA
ncbi:MAG TPA: alanine racemase, partial [Gaiellales bacterium]